MDDMRWKDIREWVLLVFTLSQVMLGGYYVITSRNPFTGRVYVGMLMIVVALLIYGLNINEPRPKYKLPKKKGTKMFKVMVFFLIILAIIALGLFAGTIYFAIQFNPIGLVMGIGLLVVISVLKKSVVILVPEEMGELILFGKPVGFRDSGLHLVPPLPKCYIEKRPKTLFDLDYNLVEVVTKEGFFPEGSTEEKDYYGSVVIKVDPVAYVALPQTDEGTDHDEIGNLSLIIQRGVPFTKEGLQDFTQESVQSILRIIGSQKTWGELVQDLADMTSQAHNLFQKESPLVMAGFARGDVRLGIKRVILPKELENALLDPEKQKFAKTAAITQAEATAEVNLITSKAEAEAEFYREVGSWLHTKARALGLSMDELDQKMREDEVFRLSVDNELISYFEKLHREVELAKQKAFFDLNVGGAGSTGISGLLAQGIALWKNLDGGGSQSTGSQSGQVEDKPKEKKGSRSKAKTKEELLSGLEHLNED